MILRSWQWLLMMLENMSDTIREGNGREAFSHPVHVKHIYDTYLGFSDVLQIYNESREICGRGTLSSLITFQKSQYALHF